MSLILCFIKFSFLITTFVSAQFGGEEGADLNFLQDVSDDVKKQLFNIFTNISITKADKQSQLEHLASGQSESVKAAIQKIIDVKKEAIEDAFAKAEANLDGDDLEVVKQIKDVFENQDISTIEECTQVHDIVSKADPSVAKQLKIPQIPCDILKGKIGAGNGNIDLSKILVMAKANKGLFSNSE